MNKEVLRRFKWAIENPLLTSLKLQAKTELDVPFSTANERK